MDKNKADRLTKELAINADHTSANRKAAAELQVEILNSTVEALAGLAASIKDGATLNSESSNKALTTLGELTAAIEAGSKSNDKSSHRMFWLTTALFVAAAMQAIAALIPLLRG